jgi:hypothetical protein
MSMTWVGCSLFLFGCVAQTTTPDPSAPSAVPRPHVLEHASGRWITRPSLEVAITHDISEIYGTYLDGVTVYDASSTITTDSVLCTTTWAYAVSTDQIDGDAGQLVDYQLVADSCGVGTIGTVYEEYARWTARGADAIEVVEDPSPTDASVALWLRCTATSALLCGGAVALP